MPHQRHSAAVYPPTVLHDRSASIWWKRLHRSSQTTSTVQLDQLVASCNLLWQHDVVLLCGSNNTPLVSAPMSPINLMPTSMSAIIMPVESLYICSYICMLVCLCVCFCAPTTLAITFRIRISSIYKCRSRHALTAQYAMWHATSSNEFFV